MCPRSSSRFLCLGVALLAGCGSSSHGTSPATTIDAGPQEAPGDFVDGLVANESCVLSCNASCAEAKAPWTCPALGAWSTIPARSDGVRRLGRRLPDAHPWQVRRHRAHGPSRREDERARHAAHPPRRTSRGASRQRVGVRRLSRGHADRRAARSAGAAVAVRRRHRVHHALGARGRHAHLSLPRRRRRSPRASATIRRRRSTGAWPTSRRPRRSSSRAATTPRPTPTRRSSRTTST